jgi:hypothetical protein
MFYWTIVYTTFGLYRPNNVLHVFSSWLRGINKKEKLNSRPWLGCKPATIYVGMYGTI